MNTKNKHIALAVLVTLSISFTAFFNLKGNNEVNRGQFVPDTFKAQKDYAQLNNELTSENDQLEKEVDSLKQQQELLFSRMEEMSQQISELSASLDSALTLRHTDIDTADNGDLNVLGAVQNQEHHNQNHEISKQEKLMLLEEAFYDEDTEDGWSSVALDEITSSLDTLEDKIKNGVSLSHAECHSTICRLEINFDDENADKEFYINFAMALAWNTTAFHERLDSPGENRSVIYLSRDGHALPIDQ